MTTIPLIVIVGPTASGKTSLSIQLAKTFRGEVVSADSRQVYRGLDIGSGKVTEHEMAGVPHHLLNIADPQTVYTASDFKRDAREAVEAITSRGHLPVVVGGTFFYVDTLLGDISFPQVPPNDKLRSELETLPVEELYSKLLALDPNRAASIDKANPRRLVRAIEIATTLGEVPLPTPTDSPHQSLKLGILIDRETLHANIHNRLLSRLKDGMTAEVESLLADGVSHERLESFGLEYRYISRYLKGEISYDDMVRELEIKIRQFAKRQYTWLKRDTDIHWVSPNDTSGIEMLVTNFLATNPFPTI